MMKSEKVEKFGSKHTNTFIIDKTFVHMHNNALLQYFLISLSMFIYCTFSDKIKKNGKKKQVTIQEISEDWTNQQIQFQQIKTSKLNSMNKSLSLFKDSDLELNFK